MIDVSLLRQHAELSVPLVLGGIFVPLVALLLAAVFGKFVMKLNNLVTLGYTITYAVGNVLLTVWGTVIVALFATKTAV